MIFVQDDQDLLSFTLIEKSDSSPRLTGYLSLRVLGHISATMQASTSAGTSYEDLLRSAADPSNALHNVYLLMQIRKHKKEVSDQRVQMCKVELVKKLVDDQKEVSDSVAKSMANKRNSLVLNNPGAGDSRRTDEKRYSFPPGDSKAASRLSAASKKSSIGLKNIRSSTSSELAVVSDFYSVIELISKFYNISDHEEFVRNRNQLMETLSLLKNYKSFDDILNQYTKKYKDLCDLKKRFGDVVGEEVSDVYSSENL